MGLTDHAALQMEQNEMEYKAKIKAQTTELEILKRKLADKERHDEYRILI